MKAILIWVFIAALIVLGVVLYRSKSGNRQQVDPNAAQEIERARQR